MTDLDLGWAAGFYEGEGHISCVLRSYSLLLAVTQNDHAPLRRFGAIVGVGKLKVRNDRSSSTWEVQGKEAAMLARILGPHLSIRRQAQIDAALQKWERRLHGPKTICKYGHPFTPENVYEYKTKDGRMKRHCRICDARRNEDARERRSAAGLRRDGSGTLKVVSA